MAIMIIATVIILYIILIGFTWHNLDMIKGTTKMGYIFVGILAMAISTLIVFNISASGITYENKAMIGDMRSMLVAVFTPINGLIVMPFLANMIGKINLKGITQEQFKKRAIILAIVFIAILVFEYSYLQDIQQGILKMANNA